jgi:hypothetical protein
LHRPDGSHEHHATEEPVALTACGIVRGTVNLNNLEQFEGITLTSKPLKGRNPRRPETVTEHAKSVQVPMLSSGRRTWLDGLKLNAPQRIALPTG